MPSEDLDLVEGLRDERPDPLRRVGTAQLVWGAVDKLSPDLREVLVLRDVEAMPSKEVAAALGITDALVRQRLHRGRQFLAERLRPELVAARELTCGGDLSLLYDYVDGELPRATLEPVSEHLDSCRTCGGYLRLFTEIVALPLKSTASSFDPGPESESMMKILTRFKAERG